jgi:predicted esterase
MNAADDFVHRYFPARGSTSTLLLLHGTGGDENDLIPLGQAMLPGAALLSPRGKVLENGMPRFFRRFAEGVFDVADIRLRASELARFVAAAAEKYGFDTAGVTAAGYSNGANIAAAVLLLHPGVIPRAVLFRAMLPLKPEHAPALAGTRVLLSSGRYDPIAGPEDPERLASVLTSGGANVVLKWQNAGHNLTNEDLIDAREWLHSGS